MHTYPCQTQNYRHYAAPRIKAWHRSDTVPLISVVDVIGILYKYMYKYLYVLQGVRSM